MVIKMKSYCTKCEKETEIKIEKTIINKHETKYEGKCWVCEEYLCRVILIDNKT